MANTVWPSGSLEPLQSPGVRFSKTPGRFLWAATAGLPHDANRMRNAASSRLKNSRRCLSFFVLMCSGQCVGNDVENPAGFSSNRRQSTACRIADLNMACVTDGSSGQSLLDHSLISSLNVQRAHCRQYSFAQARSRTQEMKLIRTADFFLAIRTANQTKKRGERTQESRPLGRVIVVIQRGIRERGPLPVLGRSEQLQRAEHGRTPSRNMTEILASVQYRAHCRIFDSTRAEAKKRQRKRLESSNSEVIFAPCGTAERCTRAISESRAAFLKPPGSCTSLLDACPRRVVIWLNKEPAAPSFPPPKEPEAAA